MRRKSNTSRRHSAGPAVVDIVARRVHTLSLMAAKKNFGAKAEFIRTMPPNMSAKAIIDEAKKKGLTITSSHIYNLRAKAADPSGGNASRRRGRHGGTVRSSNEGVEAALRKAIAEIGLGRARQVLAEVEARFGSKN